MVNYSGAITALIFTILLFYPITQQAQSNVPDTLQSSQEGGILVLCNATQPDFLEGIRRANITLLTNGRVLDIQDCGQKLEKLAIVFPPDMDLEPILLTNTTNTTLTLSLGKDMLIISSGPTKVEKVYCKNTVYTQPTYYLKIYANLAEGAYLTIRTTGENITQTFYFSPALLEKLYQEKGYTPIPPAACNSPLPQLIIKGSTFVVRAVTREGTLIMIGQPGVPLEEIVKTRYSEGEFASQTPGGTKNDGSYGESTLHTTPNAPPPVLKEGAEEKEPGLYGDAFGERVRTIPGGLAGLLVVIGVILVIIGMAGSRRSGHGW